MKAIEAYQTSDGQIFNDERKAASHQEDILGEMLDDFLPDTDHGMTRVCRHGLLMKQLRDPELKSKIQAIYRALCHDDDD